MTKREEINRLLDVAINTQDHAGYAAAARVHWPEALLEILELTEMLDEASAVVLRLTKKLEVADAMLYAVREYVMAEVKKGPYMLEEEGTKMLESMSRYAEVRGIAS